MRLIDADELKKNFQDELCKGIACAECSIQVEGFCRVERWIDIAPTIEVEPVKHGRWINVKISISGNSSAECSLCGAVVHNNFSNVINYCPNCGARMNAQIGEDKSHPFAESVMMGKDGGEK